MIKLANLKKKNYNSLSKNSEDIRNIFQKGLFQDNFRFNLGWAARKKKINHFWPSNQIQKLSWIIQQMKLIN